MYRNFACRGYWDATKLPTFYTRCPTRNQGWVSCYDNQCPVRRLRVAWCLTRSRIVHPASQCAAWLVAYSALSP